MAMVREGEVQGDLVVTWARLLRSPGHAFYDQLQNLMAEAGLNAFRDGLQALLPASDGVLSLPSNLTEHHLLPCRLLERRGTTPLFVPPVTTRLMPFKALKRTVLQQSGPSPSPAKAGGSRALNKTRTFFLTAYSGRGIVSYIGRMVPTAKRLPPPPFPNISLMRPRRPRAWRASSLRWSRDDLTRGLGNVDHRRRMHRLRLRRLD